MIERAIKIVVPSHQRPENVKRMESLFPGCIWCVSESEADSYKTENKLTHPDSLYGIAAKRQWILDRISGVVFQVDDDIEGLWVNMGNTGHRITRPEQIYQVIENAAEMARGFGSPVFGFNQAWGVRKYNPHDPFSLSGWVGTAYGFIGRRIKFDQNLSVKASDVDFCLQALLKERVIFSDKRFGFICTRFTNAGGLSALRTQEKYDAQVAYFFGKWGQWAKATKAKSTVKINTQVERRQPISL